MLGNAALGFALDLQNGAISNGSLSITESGSSTPDWTFSGFGGSVAGAFVNISNMSGDFKGTVASGDLRGAFIGTGTYMNFVGGFSVNTFTDGAQGLVLLHDMRSVPQ